MSDLIDRQAAIDALDEQIEQCNKSLSSFDISMKDEYAVKVERASLVAFREILEYLPSAQPERIKGRWEVASTGYSGFMRCSACKTGCCGDNRSMNFCPNCGADMRGEQDE